MEQTRSILGAAGAGKFESAGRADYKALKGFGLPAPLAEMLADAEAGAAKGN